MSYSRSVLDEANVDLARCRTLLGTPGRCKGKPQQCGRDPATRPSCRSGAEPECDGNGNWVCPVVICDPTGPEVCRGECGLWDNELCECTQIPPFCRGEQCDEHHRWECEADGGRWDDYWCYCEYIYEDGLQSKPPRPALRSKRLGHFAPIANSCEEQRVPTSLAMSLGDVRLHTGGPLTRQNGTLRPHVWGTAQLVRWGVRDQNTALFKRGDMLATEWVTQVGGQPASNDLDRTVLSLTGCSGTSTPWCARTRRHSSRGSTVSSGRSSTSVGAAASGTRSCATA